MKELDFDKALELRGAEFQEMLSAFHAVAPFPRESARVDEKKRMRIGIAQ